MPRNLRQFLSFFVSSFKTYLRTPSAWIWGLIFPILFIILFGFISLNQVQEIRVGLLKDDSRVYTQIETELKSIDLFKVKISQNYESLQEELDKGDLDGLVRVNSADRISLISNSSKPENVDIIRDALSRIRLQILVDSNKIEKESFRIIETKIDAREIKYIDFVLPGILGYSLLSATVFGVATSFLILRKNLVLKRLFAGPTNKTSFIMGLSLSRLFFILLQSIALIWTAVLIFDYSPNGGSQTIWHMITLICLALVVFLGFGYFVAGIAKNEEVVSPVSNLIVVPQILLTGSFFSISNLPSWLQIISRALPLYNFNEALRLIAIDGQKIWSLDVLMQITPLALWGALIYLIATKMIQLDLL